MFSVNTIKSFCLSAYFYRPSISRKTRERQEPTYDITKDSNRKSNDTAFCSLPSPSDIRRGRSEGDKRKCRSDQAVKSSKHVCLFKGRQLQSSSL